MKMKQKKFYIIDWAGNDKTDYFSQFNSFEAAWERLYYEFRNLPETEYEEQLGEFEVMERACAK